MILILGLGNPGEKYEHTRHNAGFLFLDFLQEAWEFPPFASSNRFESLVSKGIWNHHSILLSKPETYMNLSGKSAEHLLRYHKLTERNLAVIHDDIDISEGNMRATDSSSCAGHHGVSDIINRLGTQDFFRIRIGIGRPGDETPLKDFVLLPFSRDEYRLLHDETFPKIRQKLEAWIAESDEK